MIKVTEFHNGKPIVKYNTYFTPGGKDDCHLTIIYAGSNDLETRICETVTSLTRNLGEFKNNEKLNGPAIIKFEQDNTKELKIVLGEIKKLESKKDALPESIGYLRLLINDMILKLAFYCDEARARNKEEVANGA